MNKKRKWDKEQNERSVHWQKYKKALKKIRKENGDVQKSLFKKKIDDF